MAARERRYVPSEWVIQVGWPIVHEGVKKDAAHLPDRIPAHPPPHPRAVESKANFRHPAAGGYAVSHSQGPHV